MHSNYSENIAVLPSDRQWGSATQEHLDHAPSTHTQECILDKVTTSEAKWTTLLLNIPAQSRFNLPANQHYELFVLEGELRINSHNCVYHSYKRFPADQTITVESRDEKSLLFCKIQHQETGDNKDLHTKTKQASWLQGSVPGLAVMPLHSHEHENIALVRWAPNTQFHPHVHPAGEEIIVLEGTFHDDTGSYPSGTWLRNAPFSKHTPYTKEDGALIYVKTGHLPNV